jgi:hypothetical protein
MKRAITITAVGIVLILASLIFSSGHHPQLTFLGNLQQMEIVLVEGKYVTSPRSFIGHYQGRVGIPTKYPFIISVIITVAGLVMIINRVTSRY